MNTTLPTEPGYYLFCGSRTGRYVDVERLTYIRGAEVVKVTRTNDKLMFVGNDFFHEPEETVGAWMPISAEVAALLELARKEAIRRIIAEVLPPVFANSWYGGSSTRSQTIDILARSKMPSVRDAANEVFDAAVAAGVIVKDESRGADWWKLV